MSALQNFIDDGWSRHADEPQAVADALPQGLALIESEQDVIALNRLAHHVFGEHLAQWGQGLAFVRRLVELSRNAGHLPAGGAAESSCRCSEASLLLGQGQRDAREALSLSERIEATAMAAASLALHDTPRALALMSEALRAAETAALPNGDPVNRALAVACNNLASTLEEQPERDADERALMILAAEAARRYWAIAGTWLHVERAEFRLAHTWLKAGDPRQSREHALACLAIVAENRGAAIERFFGHEPLVLAERALGDAAAADAALATMRAAFAELSDEDRDWCAATLHKLSA